MRRIVFLASPGFSLVGFMCAYSAFKQANQAVGRDHYVVSVVSEDGVPVETTAGITVSPDSDLRRDTDVDLVFVCAGPDPWSAYTSRIGAWLRFMQRRGCALGGITTGAVILAKAGLMDGYRCTVFRDQADPFAKEFPRVVMTGRLFEVDRDRFTCAGGTTAIDLCVHLIAVELGEEVAAAVSSAFVLERIRNAEEPRMGVMGLHASGLPGIVTRAISMMRARIEEPARLDEVSKTLGISTRHLGRVFRRYLNTSPTDFYMRVRLTRAQELIRETDMSAQQVAVACGFRSASHFSTAYRRVFGVQPSKDKPHTV